MSTIITIGDIHGRSQWEQIVKKHPDANKIIFIGDYFDSFDIPAIEQLYNFKNIIRLKEENPDIVELLFGNHSYHYLRGINERYSGYQPAKAMDISEALHNALNKGHLKMCHIEGEFLFTHAGVTKTWCKRNNIDMNNLEQSINDLFQYKPGKFRFTGHELSGDDITQTPIWVRPQSLLKDRVDGYTQVVGHTAQDSIKIYEGLILTDALEFGYYLKIVDGKPEMCKL